MSCYSYEELQSLGIETIGENVRIHRSVQMFSPQNIHFGNHVRIDCFAFLSAGSEGIHIGNHVHIGVGSCIFGACGRILIEDFCGLSARVSLYTSNDDFSEGHMTNPTIPDEYKKVRKGPVTLRKHALIGSGSVIMNNVELGIAVSVGALTFITKNIGPFTIVHGNPARIIGKRDARILDYERKFLNASKY